MRLVFHDRDDAAAVAARLRTDGFDVELLRERFAGEDDDEDHPWVVLTDAPELVVEVLAEEHDGWVDHHDLLGEPAPSPPGLELPDGPRRVKGHFTGRDGGRD